LWKSHTDSHLTKKATITIRASLLVAALACLLCAGLLAGLEDGPRAWLLLAGFILLVPVVALSPHKALAPIAVAVIFVVYGGLSALVAVPESAQQNAENAKVLTKDQLKASKKAPEFEQAGISEEEAFEQAALLTALAGLAAIGGTYWGAGYLRRRGRPAPQESAPAAEPPPGRIEMAGRALVVAAFFGVAAALARFVATQIPTDDLHMAIKSFWEGGSYFLLVATFAIPGFGLWLQGALTRGASRREIARIGAWAALYLALLVPTGQRGFAIALGLMALVILFFDGRLQLRRFLAIVAVGIVLIGVSQAARNEIRENSGFSPSEFVSRLAPVEWRDLYGSQLASFSWTVQVIQYRDTLHIANPFPKVLLKPVPRQIYPGKSQGFGAEFTSRVYPEADKQGISFAIPLVAESDYAFGAVGMIAIFVLLGAGIGMAESRIANRAPPSVKPIVLATIGWCLFVLVRGDLANAFVFASGWVIPLLLVARSIGLRREVPVARVVIDALQVAPQFSGVGRQATDIGSSLSHTPLPVPLEVRCAKDVETAMAAVFPASTTFHAPLKSSRPRLLRIVYQQLWAPVRDRRSTVLVSLGDQAPFWGRARLVFAINDVRRITRPDTVGGRLEALFYRTVLRRGAHRARRILTISRFSRDEIVRLLKPWCPIVVVASHPPDVADVDPQARPNGEEVRFVTVGALRGYKGHDTVLQALADLNGGGRAAAEVVCVGGDEAGGGRERELADRARELGIDKAFQLRGWVSDDELNDLVCSCTATVNPSTYEGYGLPVAESIARGLPTIASDIPPHREIAEDAALYFAPGDAQGLAAAMDRVADDSILREQLAQKARDRWLELCRSRPSLGEAIRAAVEEEIASAVEAAVPDPAVAY
jgi:glycosyltransferase involved in cell wall biosynthesis